MAEDLMSDGLLCNVVTPWQMTVKELTNRIDCKALLFKSHKQRHNKHSRLPFYPVPHISGDGVLFSIDFFVCLFVCLFISFFVSLLARLWEKRLDQFAWNFQGRCGVTMGWPDYIFGQFRETARCRDVQHGDGVCCAFAPQLVSLYRIR